MKCYVCGTYNPVPGSSPRTWKMRVFPYIDAVKEKAVEAPYDAVQVDGSEEGLNPEMLEFIQRTATKLTQIHPQYNPEVKSNLLEKRAKFVNELTSVFEEGEDFTAWFDRTKTRESLSRVDLMQIIYDSLEGLRSQEAREMREAYAEAMKGPSLM